VFEQAAVAGGAVKTGEYTLPGFRHDWAAMNLSLFAGSAFFKAYGAELARHGCAFVPVNRPFASSFPDGMGRVSTDMAETLAAIRALSPAMPRTWETLWPASGPRRRISSAFWARRCSFVRLHISCSKHFAPRASAARWTWGGSCCPRPAPGWKRRSSIPMSAPCWAPGGCIWISRPDVAGGAMFPYLEGMAGQAFGMVIGQGGADTVTRALVAAIEARGGRWKPAPGRAHPAHGRQGHGGRTGRRPPHHGPRAVIAGVAPAPCPG
jgi:phytoene dehydrogenase-like protein